MTSAKPKHIVIIGAGVIGTSIAYFLSRFPNSAITVIEQDVPGSGASGHSFAWINAFGKDPRDYHTLNRRSLDMWYRLEHQLNEDIGIHYGGEMRWEIKSSEAKLLKKRIQQLQDWGYPCRLITSGEMLALVPGLNLDSVKAASYSEADCHIETDKYISICLERAREYGTNIHTHTKVTGFGMHNGNIATIRTDHTEFPCDVVVLASGVQTTRLASLVNVDIPQQCSPGIVIKTTPCDPILHNVAIIHVPSKSENYQHLHLRQLRDETLRIGQGSQEGINRDDSQEHADMLLAQVKEVLPAIGDIQAIPTPVGYRPMPLDGYPIIGFTEKVNNLYIALMHSGVTLAPLVGEMCALEIADGACVDWFSPYRLERFG